MLKNQSNNIGCFGLALMLIAAGFALSGSGNQVIMGAGLCCSVLFLLKETISNSFSFNTLNDSVFAVLGAALIYRYLGLPYNEVVLIAAFTACAVILLIGIFRIILGYNDDPWLVLVGVALLSLLLGKWLI
jgi:hypothetical protein